MRGAWPRACPPSVAPFFRSALYFGRMFGRALAPGVSCPPAPCPLSPSSVLGTRWHVCTPTICLSLRSLVQGRRCGRRAGGLCQRPQRVPDVHSHPSQRGTTCESVFGSAATSVSPPLACAANFICRCSALQGPGSAGAACISTSVVAALAPTSTPQPVRPCPRVYVLDSPAVTSLLTVMRDKSTGTKDFVAHSDRLLAYVSVAHAAHTPHSRSTHDAHTPHSRRTHAAHTSHTRRTHAVHTPHTCRTHAAHTPHTRRTHAVHTPHTRRTHAAHTPHTRRTHAVHTPPTHAAHTPYTRTPQVRHAPTH
jgi:hypothetical protein